MTTPAEPDFDTLTMRLALDEAKKSQPSPNPPVGAVVVSAKGKVVAAAHHARAGEEHAEGLALAMAGSAAKGGTLFVTLEPCNHEGRTPPCVDQILKAGIARVVIGCVDPNPNVQGGGAARLTESGIPVEIGVAGAEARALIAPWTKFITTGIPHVSLKLALSLDGRIATRSGASKWVTGPEARAKVQELRSQHDAVAVGIGTALVDDPRLTVRDSALIAEGKSPVRIVFDTRLRIPLHSRLVQTPLITERSGAAGTRRETRIAAHAHCRRARAAGGRDCTGAGTSPSGSRSKARRRSGGEKGIGRRGDAKNSRAGRCSTQSARSITAGEIADKIRHVGVERAENKSYVGRISAEKSGDSRLAS